MQQRLLIFAISSSIYDLAVAKKLINFYLANFSENPISFSYNVFTIPESPLTAK